MKLSRKIIEENKLKTNPLIYKIKNTIYAETIYGSFVDINESGMHQQKNALSKKELIKIGYKKQ
jgi:hypothetical protein